MSADEKARGGGGMSTLDEMRMSGPAARIIILNCYVLLWRKFRGKPLWSLVGDITGHGCGYSVAICKSANLEPYQQCKGQKLLKQLNLL